MIQNYLCDLVGKMSKHVDLEGGWNHFQLEGGYLEEEVYLRGADECRNCEHVN